jgi:hypothetical protein
MTARFCLILLLTTAACSAPESDTPASEPEAEELAPELSAGVESTSSQVSITNNDTFPWTNCLMELNTGVVPNRGGFYSYAATIAPGAEVERAFGDFTMSGGTRFDTVTRTAQDMLMLCDTPDGRASYHATF